MTGQTATTWSTWREAATIVTSPRQLRRTLTIASVVGTTFFVMNQLGLILNGHATTLVWIKSALTYVTPLVVSNIGALSATRRTSPSTTTALAGA